MAKFNPSEYSDASADAQVAAPETTGSSYLQYIPFARALVQGEDSREEAAILKAKIKNQKAIAAKTPEPIKSFYRMEISKLEAQLAVVQQQAAEDTSSVQSSALGKTVLIGVGVAAILALTGFGIAQFRR